MAQLNMFVRTFVLLYAFHVCLCVDLTYYVKEGKSPDTYIGDIAADSHLMDNIPAQDHSLPKFDRILHSDPGNIQLFRVAKKTGKLYTTQMLDAEALCQPKKECFEIVKVVVSRAKSFMKIIKVKVIIEDVNDHQPEFPEKQINIEFLEDVGIGAKISIPNAIDKDVSTHNSQIIYQMKKNMDDPFALSVSKSVDGTSDLSMILEERLDRETKDSYMIQVIAKDEGSPPKQSVLSVHISVIDVNDNAPVFTQDVYNVSIRYKHDEETPIAILSARDSDSGKNGQISYHFSSKTSESAKSYFQIEEDTGEIFLMKTFPQGQNLIYELYAKATDGGSPPLSSIAMVLVNVINQQNIAPTINVNFFFTSSGNTAAISEDVEVGSFIAYVMVTDPDIGENGQVSCNLRHNKFELQSLGTKEYKITVTDSLDRETEEHYDVIIRCQDYGSPPLHSDRSFSVRVVDVNDVQPQFSKDIYKFWIYENEIPKVLIGSINATDPDLGAGGRLTYSLLAKDKNFLPFQISSNGSISTVISLDHEFQDIYNFQVFVKDNGIPSLNNTANVMVKVRDKNDNAPHFTFPNVSPFTMDVLYYPHYTNNITVLKASDSDSRENAFLKYEIVSGNDKQLFTINHYTGLLSFTRVVTQRDAGSYDLRFVVKDSGSPVLSANVDMILTLSVSNKTLKRLNSVHVKSDESIHLVLMIVIVLVAVTLSVAITAGMSVCILRCNSRRHAPNRDVDNSCKCASESGHYTCPSQQSAFWPDALATEPDLSRTLTGRSTRGPCHGEDLSKGQKPTDGIYQVRGSSMSCSNNYFYA